MSARTFFAYLGVAGTAAFVGNMLTIGLGFGGYWQSLEPTAFMAWFSQNFFRFLIPTVASVLPFSLVGLGASAWFSRADKSVQRYWIGALACIVVACLITAGYHLPRNVALVAQTMSAGEASRTLSMWLTMHWVRVAVAMVGTALSLEALRLSSSAAPAQR